MGSGKVMLVLGFDAPMSVDKRPKMYWSCLNFFTTIDKSGPCAFNHQAKMSQAYGIKKFVITMIETLMRTICCRKIAINDQFQSDVR